MSETDDKSANKSELLLAPPNRRQEKLNGFKNNQIRSQVYNKNDGTELGRPPSVKSSILLKSDKSKANNK